MQHKKNYLALKQVIKSAKFEIQGDAVAVVAHLLSWYDSIETKITDMDKPKISKTRKE